ncbi:type VI secretion protein [Altererythrobacter aurantiacus]|uniref:Type VI secretion protein n=1 Tax=Parapontixanthobacter aurantiacus TaxID=1463599 RepID=A0A844ZF48_9SPHN|nr:type IV secretion system protein [Parapontixanthobacter aurantiacus]MXO85913.1 type VI secretion protein [Parapontixanthobacter aurantiacus]
MSISCDQAMEQVGAGVSASLRAVDCMANEMSAQAFNRLFGSDGGLLPALTILLTIYVAVFGIQLLFGRANVGVRSLTPRMLTLGLALTFATSWAAYQSVVWNLAIASPDYLASLLSGTQGSATDVFGQKIDIVFLAVQEASGGAGAGAENDISAFSPAGLLWLGAMLLLLGTVGVLVTARIALAVLVAIGPIFVVLAIFDGTRGMFVGWLKGVVMLALVPLFAVVGGSVMLELAVPVLASLTQVPGQIQPQPAAAFFLIGAVHVALMIMVIRVAGTMVSGWTVFGLARSRNELDGAPSTMRHAYLHQAGGPAQAATPATTTGNPTGNLATSRRIGVASVPVPAAANDSGATQQTTVRETRVLATSSGGQQSAAAHSGPSRASGIGSRFRSSPARSTETIR